MKNSILFILLLLVPCISRLYAQERPVEGILKDKDQSISRIKLLENEQKEIILLIADSSSIIDVDSILQTYNYSNFTMKDSIRKLTDTIQQVVILERGQLEMQDVQMSLKIKKHDEGFSLKIDANGSVNSTEEFSNARTLEISYKYWCMEKNSFWDSKEKCEKDCPQGCYKRSF